MKPRQKPLAASPLSSRYWEVDVAGKGAHVFRCPYYGVGAAVLLALSEHHKRAPQQDEDQRALVEQAASLLGVAGAVIGVCWAHPLHELESAVSLQKLSPADLAAYSHAVCEEMQDAGYNLLHLLDLFGACVPELVKRQSLVAMAEERALFTGAPVAALTA